MGAKPVIGITTSARSGWRIFPLIALSVWMAGGRSRWFRVGKPAHLIHVDGLVVGGGDDISAELYGGELVPEARIDPQRDDLEKRLVAEAVAACKPVLGICRGAQMINVALGGTLHQDIYRAYSGTIKVWTVLPRKHIEILPATRLASIIGVKPATVNALHKQSIATLGDNLRISARDGSGIVQAIETTNQQRFIMGVQWHPEHLLYAHRQRALFKAIVTAASNSKQNQ